MLQGSVCGVCEERPVGRVGEGGMLRLVVKFVRAVRRVLSRCL